MTHSRNLEQAKPRWKPFGWAVFGVVAIPGLIGLVLKALAMVRDGRGIETYRTAWLVEFSWIGLLVFIVAAVVALIVGFVLSWREGRQWRALERKYGTRNDV